jgi:hypothetical protein
MQVVVVVVFTLMVPEEVWVALAEAVMVEIRGVL